MIIEYRKTPHGLQLREKGGYWLAKFYTNDYDSLPHYFQGVIAGLDLVNEKVEEITEVGFK